MILTIFETLMIFYQIVFVFVFLSLLRILYVNNNLYFINYVSYNSIHVFFILQSLSSNEINLSVRQKLC